MRSTLFMAIICVLLICKTSLADQSQADQGDNQNAAVLQEMLRHQPPDDPSVASMSLEQKADYFLQRKNLFKLKLTLNGWKTSDELMSSLNWSKKNLMQGETIYIAYPYAANMWRVGRKAAPGSALSNLTDTAAMIVVYAYAVIWVDGQKCADVTAPSHWLEKNLSDWKDAWVYMVSLPDNKRDEIISTSISLERQTFSRRKDDFFMCGAGNDSFKSADLDKGYQIPTPSGQAGRTVYVPANPDYVPKFKPQEEYALPRGQAETQIPVILKKIIDDYKNH